MDKMSSFIMLSAIIGIVAFILLSFVLKKIRNFCSVFFLGGLSLYLFSYSMRIRATIGTRINLWQQSENISILFFILMALFLALQYSNFDKNKDIKTKFATIFCLSIFLFSVVFYMNFPSYPILNFKVKLYIIVGILYPEVLFSFLLIDSIKKDKKIRIVYKISLVNSVIFMMLLINQEYVVSQNALAIFSSIFIYFFLYVLLKTNLIKFEDIILNEIFMHSPNAIIVLSKDFVLIDQNNAAMQKFGDLLNCNLQDLSEKLIKELQENKLEIENFQIMDRIFNIGVSHSKVRKKIVSYVLSFLDVTELELLKNDLTKANQELEEKSKQKQELILTVSHDLRTPLNGIIGLSDILADKSKENKEKEHLDLINNSSKTMLKQLDDILINNLKFENSDNSLSSSKKLKSQKISSKEDLDLLIIEDCQVTIFYLKKIFEKLSINFDLAQTKEEVNNLLNLNKYNFIFTDINLGKDNIFDIFSKINNENMDAIKIASTASVDLDLKERCYDEGFLDLIEKPYDIHVIISILERYVSQL